MTHKLFVETAKDKRYPNGACEASDIREATDGEISRFRSIPCDHSAVELLIYDIPGYLYDLRACGVCDSLIGLI